MIPFSAPLDDILFTLGPVAGADGLPDWDSALASEIIAHFASFAEGELAPLNAPGDVQGCTLRDDRVQMPAGFAQAYAQLAEGGWQGLTAPEVFDGMGVDSLVAAAVSEIFSGANHSLAMVANLVPGAISTLLRFGSEQQQQHWIPKLSSGELLATMCLTEAGAGSDLSQVRTRATQTDDGWSLQGEKIFISGGDQDISDGILHLVLARSGSLEEGIKGLSLFLCPCTVNGDIGGERNAVKAIRLEEKIGLHASPTCHMVFDGAQAELIGEVGAGLAVMFTLMNHARVDVALQGVAHAARAHHIASNYAAERKQGRRSDGEPAVLSDHADVRRMLDEQRSLALGARAMAHIAGVEMALGERPALAEFLTPLCKIFCTEAGIRAADLGIQALGGYGYLSEYELSQTWRDARITAIYEGANGIHALGLATRGLRWQQGAAADAFAQLVNELAEGDTYVAELLAHWSAFRARVLASEAPAELAHDFSLLCQELLFQAVWCKIQSVADAAPNPAEIKRLAQGVKQRPIPIRLP